MMMMMKRMVMVMFMVIIMVVPTTANALDHHLRRPPEDPMNPWLREAVSMTFLFFQGMVVQGYTVGEWQVYFEGYSRWEWSCFLSWYSSFTPTQWFTWLGEPANHFHPLSWALWYLGLRRESRLLDNLLAAIRDRDILGVIAAAIAILLSYAPRGEQDPMEE